MSYSFSEIPEETDQQESVMKITSFKRLKWWDAMFFHRNINLFIS
jgi:hypothetical protein